MKIKQYSAHQMPLYAFILGRKRLLSIAEVCQVLGEKAAVTDINRESLIAQLQTPLTNPQESIDRLGGTIKIVEIFAELQSASADSAATIAEYLVKKFQDRMTKVNYGVSAYSMTERHEIFLKKILNFLKKELTKAGIKSRYINHNFKNLENAAIKGEKLLQEGAEIIIIKGSHQMYVGETKALQDFEDYGRRDYDRPGRDPRLGMLPPKLAQMMINLAGLTNLEQKPKNLTVYDPFCGMGTVLTEALHMGGSAIGSDIEPNVITKSRQNIEFVLKGSKNVPTWRLFTKNAMQLTKTDVPENISAIVTESYLGPPVSNLPPAANIAKTFKNVETTVLGFLKAAHSLLKKGTPVVLSVPVYRGKTAFFFMENLPAKMAHLGYQVDELVPKNIAEKQNLKLFPRPSLVYDRPDQIVGREIFKLITL